MKLMWCLVLAALASCSKDSGSAPGPAAAKHNGNAQIVAALSTLNQACPGLKKYFPDVITAGVTGGQHGGYEVEVIVSDAAKLVPPEFKANGQHCRYDVGSNGEASSVIAAKSPCISLCKADLYDGPPTMDHKIQ